VIDAVKAVAQARGTAPARVALAWMLSKPVVTAPIIGATKAHHLDDAIAALDLRLSDAEIRQLEAPYKPHPVRGF
jgi:aryl-alcohol dehydrogenase-like predicted oxidoreductase